MSDKIKSTDAKVLAEPSAVYRILGDCVEWLAHDAARGTLKWKGDALHAGIAPLGDARDAAARFGGTAIPRKLLDAPYPEQAFVPNDKADRLIDELEIDDQDGVATFVLPRAAFDSWRRSNALE